MKARLERLRAETEADSLTEVFRRALSTYEMIAHRQNAGQRVFIQEQEGADLKELVIL